MLLVHEDQRTTGAYISEVERIKPLMWEISSRKLGAGEEIFRLPSVQWNQ